MVGPAWARWVFALVFAGIALYRVARLVMAGRDGAGGTTGGLVSDLAPGVMAVGMAVMFVPVPTPVPPVYWAAVFGVLGAWLVACLFRPAPHIGRAGRTHLVSHLVGAVAMAVMFASLPADGLSTPGQSHAGHLAADSSVFAVLGWCAAGYFLAHAVCCGIRVATPRPSTEPARARRGAIPNGSDLPLRLVMGLGMSYMLLVML